MTRRNPTDAVTLGLHLLVLRCQAGDDRAFAQLIRQFSTRTLGYLKGIVGDAADDVQQEVWLAVYRGIASLANPGAFRTWLYRTTRHRAVDYLRRQNRERELIADVPLETVANVGQDVSTEVTMPDAMLNAMDQLTPTQREVLQLRYREEMSYAEITLVLGCPIGTVRSRLAGLVGVQVAEMARAARVGAVPWSTVVGSAMPLIDVLWRLSLLVAGLSTVGIFLRLRTASLTEIQLRLAALETMLTSKPESPQE